MSSTKEEFRSYLQSSYKATMSFQSYLCMTQEQHEAARRELGFPVKR